MALRILRYHHPQRRKHSHTTVTCFSLLTDNWILLNTQLSEVKCVALETKEIDWPWCVECRGNLGYSHTLASGDRDEAGRWGNCICTLSLFVSFEVFVLCVAGIFCSATGIFHTYIRVREKINCSAHLGFRAPLGGRAAAGGHLWPPTVWMKHRHTRQPGLGAAASGLIRTVGLTFLFRLPLGLAKKDKEGNLKTREGRFVP